MPAEGKGPSPVAILVLCLLGLGTLIALCERATARHRAGGHPQPTAATPAAAAGTPGPPGSTAPVRPAPLPDRVLAVYLRARRHVLGHAVLYAAALLCGPPLVFLALKHLAAGANRWREEVAGMRFAQPSYDLPSPFSRDDNPLCATQQAFVGALADNPSPASQVVLGLDAAGLPVYLGDRARSMHLHILGQTGSGKTQSVIVPLLYQDARRGRPVLFLDAKGSMDNEEALAAIAAATGRAADLRIFTLNPHRATHTYNPLHLVPGADPRQVAERVFSTFESDLDVQYYKDMARELWVNLVAAVASTGKAMTMLDLAAAIADPAVMAYALSLSSDRKAIRAIQSRYAQLGRKLGETYTGLLAAVNRYDHPAVNVTDPDIVLEDLVERGGLVGFSLPANAYKFQARAIGLIVLQHLQQIGALRQMDRGRSQAPLYVYADEFYTFAYEGFVDAVNKLRDANISLCLSHQSLSDLERVSPAYASAVWDNTRTKIVLYQNDAALCERLASAVGTRKKVELTVRRTVDGYLNQASALEASSREVDEFLLHPNRLKCLRPGQCYLVEAGTAEAGPMRPPAWQFWRRPVLPDAARVTGVNLAMLPPLPAAAAFTPVARTGRAGGVEGIGLHDLFVGERGGGGRPA